MTLRMYQGESMKAYIRCQVIFYVAHRDKECSRQLKELADKIADIEKIL